MRNPTVVADGPVGAIGNALNQNQDGPKGTEWALGMKFIVELPQDTTADALIPGTVWHTFGYPEPEIFGFMYAHPGRLVSVGIFVPSWLGDPSRTVYRYLQHYIQHPALWRILKNGTLRSWGAKSLEETGRRGEPTLCGDGFARIGEGSGSTNMLTGSGVDEAWTTGTQLGEAVLELLRAGKPFSKQNLADTYEKTRRASWVDRGAREAENARNGFHEGVVTGMFGMALSGLTGGRLALRPHNLPADKQIRAFPSASCQNLELSRAEDKALTEGRPLYDALLSVRGWPEIPFDGRLLVSHQDALLVGGKVQAMPGHADHVLFPRPRTLRRLPRKNLCRHVFRPGNHARHRRPADLRARKVRSLRRVFVELRPDPRRQKQQSDLRSRRRRPPLGGKLSSLMASIFSMNAVILSAKIDCHPERRSPQRP